MKYHCGHRYATRSAAIRAAKDYCKQALGPAYEAHEGPDYIIHPWGASHEDIMAGKWRDRFTFEVHGPAADPSDEERASARAAWDHITERRNAVLSIATQGATS